MAKKKNAKGDKLYYITFARWAEGSMPWTEALVVKASSEKKALDAFRDSVRQDGEGWWEQAWEQDVFAGSSVEAADENFYYIPGHEEGEMFHLQIYEAEQVDSLDEAEYKAQHEQRMFGKPLPAYRIGRGNDLEKLRSRKANPQTRNLKNSLLR